MTPLGATFQNDTARGKLHMAASVHGLTPAFLNEYLKSQLMIPAWRILVRTQPSCVLFIRQPVLKNARYWIENQAIGLNRGGRTTKINAIVDSLGNPICFLLAGGPVHDSRVACRLLETIDISQSNIIANKAYGTVGIRQYFEAQEGFYTIPSRDNIKSKWQCDYHVYCEQHLIESFFNQLKNYHRIATRYDKLAHVSSQQSTLP